MKYVEFKAYIRLLFKYKCVCVCVRVCVCVHPIHVELCSPFQASMKFSAACMVTAEGDMTLQN